MKRKINVLQMIGQLTSGGAEKVVINLSNNLDYSLVKLFITARENGPLSKELCVFSKIMILPKRDGFDFGHLIKLIRIIKKYKIDLIHSHMFGPNFFGFLAAKLTKTKLIGTIHGQDCFSSKTRIRLYRLMAPWFDQIVTVSDLLEEEFRRYIKNKSVKVKTIYNGIPLEHFNQSITKETKLKILGLPTERKIIGAVGNIRPVKGQDILIKSLRILYDFKKREDIILVFVGEVFSKYNYYKQELDSLIKELDLEKKVIFLGFRQDIPEILQIFDVYVLPSRSEGLSLSLLEALAAGKPVVATDVGMNSRVIQNELNGLIVAPNDPLTLANAIMRILNNSDITKNFGQQALKTVRNKYSVQAMSKQYEDIYKSLTK